MGAGKLKSIIIASLVTFFCLSRGFKAFTNLVGFFLEADFRFKLF